MSFEPQNSLRVSASAWEAMSEPERRQLIEEHTRNVGFSISGSATDVSPQTLVLPPSGITLPESVVVPKDVQRFIEVRDQMLHAERVEQMVRERAPVEPVIIAGAPKPSRTGTLSERSASLKNTPRGQKMNRAARRREAKKRYG